jgi:hypothetical protein
MPAPASRSVSTVGLKDCGKGALAQRGSALDEFDVGEEPDIDAGGGPECSLSADSGAEDSAGSDILIDK